LASKRTGSDPGAELIDVETGDAERARDASVLGSEHATQEIT